jgi:hypothetical protein
MAILVYSVRNEPKYSEQNASCSGQGFIAQKSKKTYRKVRKNTEK